MSSPFSAATMRPIADFKLRRIESAQDRSSDRLGLEQQTRSQTPKAIAVSTVLTEVPRWLLDVTSPVPLRDLQGLPDRGLRGAELIGDHLFGERASGLITTREDRSL